MLRRVYLTSSSPWTTRDAVGTSFRFSSSSSFHSCLLLSSLMGPRPLLSPGFKSLPTTTCSRLPSSHHRYYSYLNQLPPTTPRLITKIATVAASSPSGLDIIETEVEAQSRRLKPIKEMFGQLIVGLVFKPDGEETTIRLQELKEFAKEQELAQIRVILTENLQPKNGKESVRVFAEQSFTFVRQFPINKMEKQGNLAVVRDELQQSFSFTAVASFSEYNDAMKKYAQTLYPLLRTIVEFCKEHLPATFEERFDRLAARESHSLFGLRDRVLGPLPNSFNQICRRHDDVLSHDQWDYTPSALEDALTCGTSTGSSNWWAQTPNSVLVISGPSGSGKSVESIHGTRRLLVRKCGVAADEVFFFYFEAGEVLSLKLDNNTTLKRSDRDRIVANWVEQLVRRALLFDKQMKCLVQSNGPKKPHVVVVFDEMGAAPCFLRGLCSTVGDAGANSLACRLHLIFFGEALTSAKDARVHFVAAGTGVSVAQLGDIGSNKKTFALVYMSPSNKVFSSLIQHNDKRLSTGSSQCTLLQRFERLLSPQRDEDFARTAVQQTLLEYVTNPRCAAVLLREVLFLRNSDMLKSLDWRNDNTFDSSVYRWLENATEYLFWISGLGKFREKKVVLLYALAISALRIPILPSKLEVLGGLWNAAPSPELANSPVNVFCTVGGILVDRLQLLERKTPLGSKQLALDKILAGDFSASSDITTRPTEKRTKKMSSSSAASEFHYVLQADRSRYEFAPNFLAILRLLLGTGLDISSRWDGFERRIGELCMMLCAASSFTEALFEQKTPVTDPKTKEQREIRLNEEFARNVHAVHDSLYALKYKWLRPHPEWSIAEVRTIHLWDTSISRVTSNMIAGQEEQGCRPSDAMSMKQVEENMMEYHSAIYYKADNNNNNNNNASDGKFSYFDFLKKKNKNTKHRRTRGHAGSSAATERKNCRALVLHSIPNEQFADVIVLTPMKVILLQCKRYRDAGAALSEINFSEELLNLGIADADHRQQDMSALNKYNRKQQQKRENTNMQADDADGNEEEVSSKRTLRYRLRQRLFLLHLRRMCAKDPFDEESIRRVQVCAGFIVEEAGHVTDHQSAVQGTAENRRLESRKEMIAAVLRHEDHDETKQQQRQKKKNKMMMNKKTDTVMNLHDYSNFKADLFVYSCLPPTETTGTASVSSTNHAASSPVCPMYPFDFDHKSFTPGTKDRLWSTISAESTKVTVRPPK